MNSKTLLLFHIVGWIIILVGVRMTVWNFHLDGIRGPEDRAFYLVVVLIPTFWVGLRFVRFRAEQITNFAKIALALAMLAVVAGVMATAVDFKLLAGATDGVVIISSVFAMIFGLCCGRHPKQARPIQ